MYIPLALPSLQQNVLEHPNPAHSLTTTVYFAEVQETSSVSLFTFCLFAYYLTS